MSNTQGGTLEFYRLRHEAETPLMLKVLRALPLEELAYRPHERSASALEILRTVMDGLFVRNDLVERGVADTRSHALPSAEELADAFEERASELSRKLASLDQARWEKPATLRIGGQVVLERPLGEILWIFHFDLIHHRGQLTAYMRPMGARVPSVYGPSGDEARG